MNEVKEAIARIEFNLKELPKVSHSPDIARQLKEDWETVKEHVSVRTPWPEPSEEKPRRAGPEPSEEKPRRAGPETAVLAVEPPQAVGLTKSGGNDFGGE